MQKTYYFSTISINFKRYTRALYYSLLVGLKKKEGREARNS